MSSGYCSGSPVPPDIGRFVAKEMKEGVVLNTNAVSDRNPVIRVVAVRYRHALPAK